MNMVQLKMDVCAIRVSLEILTTNVPLRGLKFVPEIFVAKMLFVKLAPHQLNASVSLDLVEILT